MQNGDLAASMLVVAGGLVPLVPGMMVLKVHEQKVRQGRSDENAAGGVADLT